MMVEKIALVPVEQTMERIVVGQMLHCNFKCSINGFKLIKENASSIKFHHEKLLIHECCRTPPSDRPATISMVFAMV
jgi:hypothetical protein